MWRAIAVGVSALLAGVFAVPTAAHAAKNTAWNLPVQHDPQWDYGREWFAIMWGPLSAGDCVERSAYVTLSPPDAQGNAVVAWGSGILLTHHTRHADVWHQSFVFRTQFGTPVLSVGGFDGPQMTHIEEEYSNYVTKRVKVDPQLWPLIATVDWTGDC